MFEIWFLWYCTWVFVCNLSVLYLLYVLYPQIKLLYGITSKAAISLTFNLHCKVIAALFSIPYSHPTLYLRTLQKYLRTGGIGHHYFSGTPCVQFKINTSLIAIDLKVKWLVGTLWLCTFSENHPFVSLLLPEGNLKCRLN